MIGYTDMPMTAHPHDPMTANRAQRRIQRVDLLADSSTNTAAA